MKLFLFFIAFSHFFCQNLLNCSQFIAYFPGYLCGSWIYETNEISYFQIQNKKLDFQDWLLKITKFKTDKEKIKLSNESLLLKKWHHSYLISETDQETHDDFYMQVYNQYSTPLNSTSIVYINQKLMYQNSAKSLVGLFSALAYIHKLGYVFSEFNLGTIGFTVVKLIIFDTSNFVKKEDKVETIDNFKFKDPCSLGIPELVKQLDDKADVYSLGVVLYASIHGGKFPFEGTNPDDQLVKLQTGNFTIKKGTPIWQAFIILQSLQFGREKRPNALKLFLFGQNCIINNDKRLLQEELVLSNKENFRSDIFKEYDELLLSPGFLSLDQKQTENNNGSSFRVYYITTGITALIILILLIVHCYLEKIGLFSETKKQELEVKNDQNLVISEVDHPKTEGKTANMENINQILVDD